MFVLACAIPVYAQSWDMLRGLKPGDRVYVLDSTGKQNKGTFSSVSEDAISIRSVNRELSIARSKVRSVKIPSSSRRLRNALIGIGVGVAIGATTDQTLGALLRNESGESAGARAVTYIAPIALVGGIAAAVPAHKTVYRAR